MRVGINPLTETRLPDRPHVLAAVITHLPNRSGYHARRFQVIQDCLASIRRTADLPLYIWDNGSDQDFRHWLVDEIQPEYLTLSRNIGKASARTAIFRSFPPGTVICMSDDDIYYEPDWLPAHLDLLAGFPNVGAVSGCPVRTGFRWGINSTVKWAEENAELEVGRFISDRLDYEFCASIGRNYQHHLEMTREDRDYRIRYEGMVAYATAHHMQFVGLADRVSRIELWTNHAMRAEQTFDVAMDRAGMLRLTTTDRYTIHMGNIPEEEFADANIRVRVP